MVDSFVFFFRGRYVLLQENFAPYICYSMTMWRMTYI